jgi:hypothetical protein
MRWENNIKMDLKDVSCEDRGWIQLPRKLTQRRAFDISGMRVSYCDNENLC